jgi:hypothetical protein
MSRVARTRILDYSESGLVADLGANDIVNEMSIDVVCDPDDDASVRDPPQSSRGIGVSGRLAQ